MLTYNFHKKLNVKVSKSFSACAVFYSIVIILSLLLLVGATCIIKLCVSEPVDLKCYSSDNLKTVIIVFNYHVICLIWLIHKDYIKKNHLDMQIIILLEVVKE